MNLTLASKLWSSSDDFELKANISDTLCQLIKHCTRITQHFSTLGHTQVILIDQGILDLSDHECQFLNTKDTHGWAREVFMTINDEPYLYAKTTATASAYQQFKHVLDQLGHKPIGPNFLYKIPSLSRQDFCFNHVKTLDYPNEWLPARRSTFDIDHPLLGLTEVFLPKLLHNKSRDDNEPL